jgi:hypothetical protein
MMLICNMKDFRLSMIGRLWMGNTSAP